VAVGGTVDEVLAEGRRWCFRGRSRCIYTYAGLIMLVGAVMGLQRRRNCNYQQFCRASCANVTDSSQRVIVVRYC
jgi:hypothetical protein